ncbi:LAFE_0F03158g1_1 [Lachancea fermentati]|uniref:Pre-mRNA-processing factor 17 n=1 Tax=Lachancea fermentati TaxID=4955 RepID=A0A1G4MEF7_LACFM|nr:LAFE_0F03158g1_1 [Lachancea fermentati]
MSLVQGYSSDESSDQGHSNQNESDELSKDVRLSNSLSSVGGEEFNKRKFYFTKAELRSKRRKRKGQGPWSSWDTSDEEVTSNENVLELNDYRETQEEAYNSDIEADTKENSIFYGTNLVDYQGRGILHPPIEEDVDFHKPSLSFKCYLPKRLIHTYDGHGNGTTVLRALPTTGHLLLSGGNDNKVKLWDAYRSRELLRDYSGHSKAIRDTNFSGNAKQFISVSFDRSAKIWDTEIGVVKSRYHFSSVPNCATFHPVNDNEFLVGLSNSEIRHYDTRSSSNEGCIQVYDHHLSSIIALKYFPDGSKFISSSEDKTVRIWENQINIPIKQISDTAQFAMPYLDIHPENSYFAAQSMDNTIYTFSMKPKYKRHPKKSFSGHKCAGYGVGIAFSPDGQFISSGDTQGRVFIWDWKSTRILKQFEVPDKKPVIAVAWNPQETSKIYCSGNGGKIYLYD